MYILTVASHYYRDYRGTYWSPTAATRLADIICTCTADPSSWSAGSAGGDRWKNADSRYPLPLYSPSVGHQLIPLVKQTLSATAGGRWLTGGGEVGEGVGSISLVGCNAPTRLALDLEELWEEGGGGRGYPGEGPRQAHGCLQTLFVWWDTL